MAKSLKLPETGDWHDADWAAERLAVDKSTVHRFLNEGTIPGVQLGKKWYVSESELEAHLHRLSENQTFERRLDARISSLIFADVELADMACGTDDEMEYFRLRRHLRDRVIAVAGRGGDVFRSLDNGDIRLGTCPDCDDRSEIVVWRRERFALSNGQFAPSNEIGDLCYGCQMNRVKAASYHGGEHANDKTA